MRHFPQCLPGILNQRLERQLVTPGLLADKPQCPPHPTYALRRFIMLCDQGPGFDLPGKVERYLRHFYSNCFHRRGEGR